MQPVYPGARPGLYSPGLIYNLGSMGEKSAMTFVRLALLVVATLLFAVACAKPETAPTNQTQPTVAGSPGTPANSPTDEFATARANFKKHCSSCHGESGTGGLVKLDDGKQFKVPSLREGHALVDLHVAHAPWSLVHAGSLKVLTNRHPVDLELLGYLVDSHSC